METKTLVERHEKAIRLLKAIAEAERMVQSAKSWSEDTPNDTWFKHRLEVNTAIKTRLENYYNKSFKI